jgi:hypothetical protein
MGLHVLSHDSEPVINTSVCTRGLHVLSHDSVEIYSAHTSIYNRLTIVA